MNRSRSWLVLGAGALWLLVGCGSTPTSGSGSNRVALDSSGQPRVDDRGRCEWKGMPDREVSEATAAGSLVPNIRRVYQSVGPAGNQRRVLICREVDTNLDGIKDVMRTFNEKGEAVREEADTNHDGKIDSWITFSGGRVAKQVLDLNADGRPDRWKYYLDGKLSRVQRDTNGDGEPDVWEIYGRAGLDRIGLDLDFDGRVDRWDRDEMARAATETQESKSQDAGATPQDGGTQAADAAAASPAASAASAAN